MKGVFSCVFEGRSNVPGGIIALAIVGLIGLGCFCPPPSNNRSSAPARNDSSPSSATNGQTANYNPGANTSANKNKTGKPDLEVVSAKWEKGGFDTIAIWKVTLRNNTDVKLGDIKFRTAYSSETGNVVSKGGTDGLLGKDTIEKIVPPKSTRTFEVNDGFVSDEAERAGFEIVDWRVID
jgi:hypothetical protein